MTDAIHWLRPDWPAPVTVRAAVTTRSGGISAPPFEQCNLATHVGDDPAAVAANRDRLLQELGLDQVQWLEQVHGTDVVDAAGDGRVRTADGCLTRESGLACAVLTADCLPLLLCDRAGTRVAAVHAGWRGLAAGVLERALARFGVPPAEVLAWLGPAISQPHFEVGVEVLEAFYNGARDVRQLSAVSAAFVPSRAQPLKFHADLFALARAELAALGVEGVYGGDLCTYADPARFYSYRRDGDCGRMAALIWLI